MEWPKLKNIIIIMLACVNLFLLVLVVHRQWESRQLSEKAREDVIEVLRTNSTIRVDKEVLPPEMDLAPMTVSRDGSLEAQQAAALLGELYSTPSDSMRYEGEKGSAQFYTNGAFSAKFKPGAYPLAGAEPAAFALELLGRMDFQGEVLPGGASGVVTVRQLWEGAPIFDCTAVLVFEDGELREISRDVSCRLMGVPQPGDRRRGYDLVTLLLRFMDYVNKNTPVLSRITGFTAGYSLDTQTDPAKLVPTWYVETDGGGYYWNTLTGEIRPEGSLG